jgi:hypothetical protein
MELNQSKQLPNQLPIRIKINPQYSMKHHLNNHQINLIVNDQTYLVPMNPHNPHPQDVQFLRNINPIYLVLEMMQYKQNVKEVHDKVYEVGLNQQIIIDHLLL